MLKTLLSFLLMVPVLICKAQPGADSLKKYAATTGDVFTSVEVIPEFIGGVGEFSKFLARNIRYPARARESNIQGRVFATFIVEANGELSNIKILRGIGYGCDEEVIRVLSRSPRWEPGLVNNTPVPVQYNMPVGFYLSEVKYTGRSTIPPIEKKQIRLPGNDTLVQYYQFPAIKVYKREGADYVGLIYPADNSNPGLYPYKQYYINGKIKFNGITSELDGRLILRGRGVDYYPSGIKRTIVTYDDKGSKNGNEYLFFPNGKLYLEKKHTPAKAFNDITALFINCRDSVGSVLAQNGNGQWVEYDELFSRVIKSGPVSEGLPHGEWTMWENDSTKRMYTVKKGTKESEKLYLKVENKFHAVDDLPMYKSSYKELGEYIHKNVKSTKSKDIFSGTVYLTVTTTPEGQISNIEVEKPSSDVVAAEAVRLLRATEPWVSKVALTKPLKLKIAIRIDSGMARLEYVRLDHIYY